MTSTAELLTSKYGIAISPGICAKELHCSQTHIRAMCQSGELPAVKIGGRWFILTAKLAALLEGVADD